MNNNDIGVPFFTTEKNDKILFPFGPAIFHTHLIDDAIEELIEEGKKLNEKNSGNFSLASNFKYGQTYIYKDEFKDYFGSRFILPKAQEFIDQYNNLFSNSIKNKNIYLKKLWINFSKKYDFNPSHIHDGLFSFVIYCNVPQNIFSVQAETNYPIAGRTVFEYGEDISELNKINFKVAGYNNLFLIFPSKLKHFVAPYWIDEERVTVAGNINYG